MDGSVSIADGAQEVGSALAALGVVGVLRANDSGQAVAAAERAIAAGLRCVEVTFTIPGAAEVISGLAGRHPDVLIGAGTVLVPEQAEEAVDAGARFLVSPHLAEAVLERAGELGVLYVPGAMTPSEVHRAAELSGGMVKLFPVARLGGPAYVRDLLGPFPGLRLMVTGGVAMSEVADYRRAGAAVVGLGSVFAAAPEELRAALAGA
jgi:2-dehydro-3-deoxyphosphogluconate aldolase/(4S)-4-hydroxy-2-oxoglutarate aldolase